MTAACTSRAGAFIATKEHRRFTEFADAVRKHRYIGLCFGAAGVGKTFSARRYARWGIAEPLLVTWGRREPSDAEVHAALAKKRTVLYTPTVGCSFRQLRDEVGRLTTRVGFCIDEHLHGGELGRMADITAPELLIVDESERLSTPGLEHLRDVFDRTGIGVILIGMPGIERRLSRFPQLSSRVGFAHHYRPLQGDELSFVLTRQTRQWRRLGLNLDDADFTDAQPSPRSRASQVATSACFIASSFRLSAFSNMAYPFPSETWSPFEATYSESALLGGLPLPGRAYHDARDSDFQALKRYWVGLCSSRRCIASASPSARARRYHEIACC